MRKTIPLVCLLALSMTNSPLAIAQSKKTSPMPKETVVSKKQTSQAMQADPKVEAKKLKSQVKEWKKRKKDLKPLQLKDLIEENHRLRMQNHKLDVNIKNLETNLKDTIKKELMHERANAAIRDLAELPVGSYTVDKAKGEVFIGGVLDDRYGVDKATGIPFIKGVIFKVQIGANPNLDLKEVLIDEVHHENLEQEKEHNLYKYTIGHFRDYWEANKLKKGLRSMGIKLAWIVPYKDGKRVLLKEVLPIVLDQKNKKKH